MFDRSGNEIFNQGKNSAKTHEIILDDDELIVGIASYSPKKAYHYDL
jgi:hypothetical protein